MKNDTSVFEGWHETGDHRVENLGAGRWGVYERSDGPLGSAFVRCATVRAATWQDAIDRAVGLEHDRG